MIKQISLTLIGALFTTTILAQSIDDYFSSQQTINFQKLYLHTDREYYFKGDTLWFSPYILSANNNQLLAEDCNLYVELINNKGEIVTEKTFFLDKGICSGYLSFDDVSISEDSYVLRAYTDQMKPLGEDYFFRKTIKINYVRQENEVEKKTQDKNENIFIDFYPEGGFLLDGKANQMAFTAHNRNGEKVHLEGKLLNEHGMQIPIHTSYKGTGSFIFIPKSGEKYEIKAEEYKNIKFSMPEIRRLGAKLMLSQISDKTITFYTTSSDNLPSDKFYVAFFHNGKGMNYVEIQKENLNKAVTITTDYLGAGVNRIVLLNSKYEPLSERLVFINRNSVIQNIKIDLAKSEIKTRGRVEMKLSLPETQKEDDWARVSVSVVNEKMTAYQNNLADIKSYLLLDSELKGQIQTPGLYFVDDDSISSARKLDLLMLTNGWRNYVWNYMKEKNKIEFPDVSPGITFSGTVKRALTNRPFVDTDVFLNIANDEVKDMQLAQTNQNGYFAFDTLVFYDTTLVMIQAMNYRGKNNTLLELTKQGPEHSPVDKTNYENLDDIGALSQEMYHLKYINEMDLSTFFPDKNSRIIEEVEVIAKKKEETDPHFRIYSMPNQSKKITNIEQTSYQNVIQYLKGRFAGVKVSEGKVYITRVAASSQGGGKEAAFMLDGIFTNAEQIYYLPMINVDVVEIIKPPETAIFGFRGVNGVVSVFTRTGKNHNSVPKKIPGTIIKKIKGFEKSRIFYSPVYSEKDIDSEIPDYRQTLYWNPAIVVDKNKSIPLSFYSCDNLANYKIFVEGITNSGKICTGKASFVVNERR